ncbi:MAG: hypothetical protein CM1200mP27_01740 [Chloroflexota bacterium]|nr:MAG: hypothetical protein CM1200mP27_01740 [Chloroflexota bacterium]
MYHDGASNGRLMTINLHPWLIGQPFRIGYLEEALGYAMGHEKVWAATGSEIVDWYRDNDPNITLIRLVDRFILYQHGVKEAHSFQTLPLQLKLDC